VTESVDAPDRIVAIDIARCALPLERPIHIGRTTYREREYVAVRLVTAGATEGHATGYTRGLPLDAMVGLLASELLGGRVGDRVALLEATQAAHVNAMGSLWRATSLLDIALADAAARLAGRPLWRELGGSRARVPLMAVAGYHARERGVDTVVDEVRTLIEIGFRMIKLHTTDLAVIRRVRTACGDDVPLGVDVGMTGRTLDDALERCLPLDELELAFIEDPFPPDRWRLTAELASRLDTPVAAGEDAAGPAVLAELADIVGVLRVDPSASGGFAAVLGAANAAADRGARVMTHAFPDQHGHLAGAAPVATVEMIVDETINPVGRLLARRQPIEAGELVLSEEPGHGAPLDWGAIKRHTRAATHLAAG
jgi:L-alanine-DL-glutamate epimerase-like enolase superfamily enzyme